MEELTLRIDRLAAGGDGVGRAEDGRVVFVPFTAPGDLVRVAVHTLRPRFARAELVDLLERGPDRCEPRCEVFGECGGCSWQHLRYERQLEAKRDIVRDALARIGGLRWPHEIPIVPSPSPWAYRGRTRILVREGRIGYRRRRSEQLVPVSRCPVLVPRLEAALAELAAKPPLDGDWELTAGENAVSVWSRRSRQKQGVQLVVADEQLGVSGGVFVQSNALMLEELHRLVIDAAGEGESALELFAGAGFFTLALARRFARLTAVESSPAALGDLRANLRRAGLAQVEVIAGAVEELALEETVADVVLLDPPRAGLGEPLSRRLAKLGARRIVYLSCDPATLARDLRALHESDLELCHIQAFDLFPQTPHVEVLAVLEQAEPSEVGQQALL